MPTVLKLSRQRQLTLTRAIIEALGHPRFFEAQLRPDRTLVLRPALKMTLAEAEEVYREHGITKEVLVEALRIVQRREKAAGGTAGGRTGGG